MPRKMTHNAILDNLAILGIRQAIIRGMKCLGKIFFLQIFSKSKFDKTRLAKHKTKEVIKHQ